MKDFDYIILGGGLSGLSLAYELNRQGCLVNKTLCILEKEKNTQKIKTGLFGILITINLKIVKKKLD